MVDEEQRPARTNSIEEARRRVRIASNDDNALLVDLMADVPMQGTLALATRRDPDFFALYRMQKATPTTWLYDDGKVQGMGASIVRDGFLDGGTQRVGYLGDLRIRGAGPARRAFPFAFASILDEHIESAGCAHFYTAVLGSNASALRALANPKSSRAGQPLYAPLRDFDMVSIHLVRRRRIRAHPGLSVRTATPDDVAAITTLLHADHRTRPFGYRFDDGEFEHRLAHWPGFSLARTFLVHDDNQRLVGCCTAWDASAVKRYRVLRYGGEMVWVKRGFALASTIFGGPPLPDVGGDFRYFYLCNLSIVDDNPAILRALLDHVYDAHFTRDAHTAHHFFSYPLYAGDALAPAHRGFVARTLPFKLFGVTSSKTRRTTWPDGRPGFEMALA